MSGLLADNEYFYLVWCEARMDSTVRHVSEADAKREAERLATANPGKRFYVMKACGFARVTPPSIYVECNLDPEIPF